MQAALTYTTTTNNNNNTNTHIPGADRGFVGLVARRTLYLKNQRYSSCFKAKIQKNAYNLKKLVVWTNSLKYLDPPL